jgi:GNAT superfamily N-acetyltransferase
MEFFARKEFERHGIRRVRFFSVGLAPSSVKYPRSEATALRVFKENSVRLTRLRRKPWKKINITRLANADLILTASVRIKTELVKRLSKGLPDVGKRVFTLKEFLGERDPDLFDPYDYKEKCLPAGAARKSCAEVKRLVKKLAVVLHSVFAKQYVVVKAQPRDAPELAVLENALSLDQQALKPRALAKKFPLARNLRAVQEREVRALLRSRRSVVFKAVDSRNGAIIGFLVGDERLHRPRFARRRYAHLYALFVLPAWRREGVAAALFAAFERWAKARRLSEVSLKVCSRNAAGRAFYERMGAKCFWLELKKFV